MTKFTTNKKKKNQKKKKDAHKRNMICLSWLSLREALRLLWLCDVLSLLVQHNIQKTVRTLWQQLVAQRRQELEDTFKIDLSVKPGESEVKIEEITPLWEETMLKARQHYLGLCLLGFREQNFWVSKSQAPPEFHSGPTPLSSLWWVGFTSLKLHKSLLKELMLLCISDERKARGANQASRL